jgi:hypothetical protein
LSKSTTQVTLFAQKRFRDQGGEMDGAGRAEATEPDLVEGASVDRILVPPRS